MLKKIMVFILTTALTLGFGMGAFAKAAAADSSKTSYRTVTEIQDWGAAITKVIVDLGKPVPQGSITKDSFKVHVARSDTRLTTPLLEEGDRTVTNAYVADKDGNPAVATGKYAVLEMKIGPTVSLGSPLNYYAGSNIWINSDYTITQVKDIVLNSGTLSGLVIDTFAGDTRELVGDFSTSSANYDDVTLTYADFAPAKDKAKNPLIIWLHGGGEGGTDPSIPLSANKAVNLATDEIQSYFNGAYVLVPQTPTFWMDGLNGRADGTSKYQGALMALIQDYVANNPDIDPNRIYIGGASNGGYMTMLMVRDYPGFFAAAFPVCEGLRDELITDADIAKMKQTPIWFVAAKNDTTLPVAFNTLPTYERLLAAGAENVHLSLFDDVHDTTGLYKNIDGTPYQYNGHWSWIYVYNNEATSTINGQSTTIMEWMAAQSK